jgi:hypothetical protein
MPDAASSAPSASLPSWRVLTAGATTILVLSIAVIAGLTSDTTGGTPVIFVSRLSSAIDGVATRAGGVWWSYAFLLGAVAAFNPCGFALLPAYLGLAWRIPEAARASRRGQPDRCRSPQRSPPHSRCSSA